METVTIELEKYLDYKASKERLSEIEQGKVVEYIPFYYSTDRTYLVVITSDNYDEFIQKVETGRNIHLSRIIEDKNRTIKELKDDIEKIKDEARCEIRQIKEESSRIIKYYSQNKDDSKKSIWQKLFS